MDKKTEQLVSAWENILNIGVDIKDELIKSRQSDKTSVLIKKWQKWIKDTQEFTGSSFKNVDDLNLIVGLFNWKEYSGGNNHTNARKYVVDRISEQIKSVQQIVKHLKNEIVTQQSVISISRASGICKKQGSKEICYGISGDRLEVVMRLRDGVQTAGKLLEGTYSDLTNLSKAISELNRLFIKKLDLDKPLIINKAKRGYCLNSFYKIKFLDN
ncbi:hypothetical protein KKA15_04420 [Patescibacteria group bacterium]|nr:hypothetical protein [Patescibacteria group bacterium]